MKTSERLRRMAEEHRAGFSKSQRLPEKFWEGAVELAKTLGTVRAAKELGVSPGYLSRKSRESSARSEKGAGGFVQIPAPSPGKSIVLELPHGIRLRIEA